MARSPAGSNTLVALACGLFALPLVAHAYAGAFSRYFADDYCAGYIFHDYGLLGGQKWFYTNWGAVPTTLLLMAATEAGGARLASVLPAVAIVAWVATGAWAIHAIAQRFGEPLDRWKAFLLAELVVFVTIADAPNVIQSVYLRIPLFEYVGPLVAMTAYAGFLARMSAGSGRAMALVASGAITFVAGSLGPSFAALQSVALGLAFMLARGRQRPLNRLLLAGVAGSIAALVFVVLAPGNAARQLHYPQPPGVFAIGKWSVLSTVFMFARPILPLLRGAIAAVVPGVFGSTPSWLPMALEMATSPLTLILAIAVPGWMAYTNGQVEARQSHDRARHSRHVVIAAPMIAIVLVMACVAPSAYGTSAPPPPRALIIPGFVMTVAAMCWGYAWGMLLRLRSSVEPAVPRSGHLIALALVVIACWSAVTVTAKTVHEGRALHAWAARWDEMDAQLRRARARGERDVVVPTVESVGGVVSFSSDPADWVNNCAARYYGLNSVTPAEGR
jgi:hypothetical protein